jgi:ribonuclease Y
MALLFLAQESGWTQSIIALVIGLVIGVILGFFALRVLGARGLAAAKREAEDIVKRAETDARTAAEKLEIEAEKKALARKEEFDKEVESTRDELRERERKLGKREDLVDRKEETLTIKENTLSKESEALKARETKLSAREEELDAVLEQQRDRLLQIAGMSLEEAKELVLTRVEDESRLEAAKIARKLVEEAELESKERAREITINAIQRFATEHTSESTVRSVAIPSDDMKGRIIGREGRNIRAIEKATGVDIIVDDTPGVIVVSCFDKVRQAVAVEALERLIADGRMHPTRIEEVVETVRVEFDEKIIKYGKDAMLEANLRGVHPKVSEAMGKLHFRTSFGQNVLRHSLEVAYLCQIIADQLGMDGRLARRCGFLHDIGKAMDHEMEGGHPKIGMDFARQFGEKELNELQDIAMSYDGVGEAYAIQAGREVRVMVDAKKVGDDEAYMIASRIAKRISDEMTFPGEIKVTVLRETRAIEIAR